MLLEHGTQLKTQKLVSLLAREQENLLRTIQEFSNHTNKTCSQSVQLTTELLDAIDRVLNGGDWDSSLFLKNLAIPIRQMRDKVCEARHNLLEDVHHSETHTSLILKDQEVKIYILLYQSDGNNMQKWEMQLNSIAAHIAGRPVYACEQDVCALIRTKVLNSSEAYISVAVDRSCIVSTPFSRGRRDSRGFELLTLETGSVTPKDILEFVHLDRHYIFLNQTRLVLKSSVDIIES